ncbi:hypothetical protein HY631_02100 [Candidatus Uhrbacteria bacterium]|nr:hypothetical protein [Candidatus Uhrbacteria bacterium]
MMKKRLTITILALALAGMAVSLYSLLHNQGFASGEFCTIGEALNCDVVNKGPYSVIFGIPVSLIGVLGYLFLAAAAAIKLSHPSDKSLTKVLFFACLGGLLFSLYLSGLEAFILTTWCLLCLTSQLLILLLSLFTFWLMRLERQPL